MSAIAADSRRRLWPIPISRRQVAEQQARERATCGRDGAEGLNAPAQGAGLLQLVQGGHLVLRRGGAGTHRSSAGGERAVDAAEKQYFHQDFRRRAASARHAAHRGLEKVVTDCRIHADGHAHGAEDIQALQDPAERRHR